MKSNFEYKSYSDIDHLRLFMSFAESLKTPLLQVARSAELSHHTGKTEPLKDVAIVSDNLQTLIDSYVLSIQMEIQGSQLQLEPVSIGAALNETAHAISAHASKYSCDVELLVAGKYGPILAHPAGLQAALLNIGQALIEAQSQNISNKPAKRQVIKFAAHKTGHGIVAGVFTDISGIDSARFKVAKQLYGNAKQPLSQLTSASGAGIFVASSLLGNMSSGLRPARYQKQNGLAATFTPSQQLALV